MIKERTLTIFLEDGIKEGVKHLRIGSYTGEMLFAPRASFDRVKTSFKDVLSKRGIYFLFGEGDDGLPRVYIGQTDCLSKRLAGHDLKKEFWDDFAVFTERHLGRTEVSYLESAFIRKAINANSYNVENKRGENSASNDIPRGTRAECERHIENIQLMLEMADRDILSDSVVISNRENDTIPVSMGNEVVVFFKNNFGDAEGVYNYDSKALKVIAGSKVSPVVHPSWKSEKWKKVRNEYLQSGEIIVKDDRFSLKNDLEFPSPSAAAAFIYAGESNGRENWKTREGKSINDLFFNQSSKERK